MTSAPHKEIIILQHGGGELANQLWNFASIYAYCKEKGFGCQNYSFFEYGQYFDIPLKNRIINFIFFRPFQDYYKRRSGFRTRFWRLVYKIYVAITMLLHKEQVVSSTNVAGKVYYLPPTAENLLLEKLTDRNDTLYFTGWLFRNPRGMEKYKKEITAYLRPKEKYTVPADERITEARSNYRNIVGVHIRQSDYRTHKSGEYFIPQERVREILDEYLVHMQKTPAETLFVVTSDEPIEEKIFEGINILINKGNAVEDLYTLSLCDIIIGSFSSFGNFAAYYGDKLHIVFQKERMDWDQYNNKNNYVYAKDGESI